MFYPTPQAFTSGTGRISLPQDFQLIFQGDVSSSIQQSFEAQKRHFLAEEYTGANGVLPCRIRKEAGFIPEKVSNRPTARQEGFSLEMRQDGITLTAASDAGLFNGFHTIQETFRYALPSGFFSECAIQDAPLCPIRGVHLYLPAVEDLEFFRKYVSRFLAPLHHNTIFLEIGGGMELERHPEINEGWRQFSHWIVTHDERPTGPGNRFQDSAHAELGGGSCISKAQVKEMVECARLYGIEVIPEVQSLTHSYYLMASHREIAELPEALWPDAYCPSNPASRQLFFDVLDEVTEVIQPSRVHIGHDEWRAAGLCPKCRERSTAELFAEDVIAIHERLQAQGMQTVMWADGLLPFVDGLTSYQCIDSIPRDILLLHWGWNYFGDLLDEFSSRGFSTILGNFNSQITPQEWSRYTSDSCMLGAEVSSWIGLNYDRFAIEGTLWHMLQCANMLWNGSKNSPGETDSLLLEALPSVASRLNDAPHISCAGPFKSECLDLGPYLNVPSSFRTGNADWNLDTVTPGKRFWRGIPCDIPNLYTCKQGIFKCVAASAQTECEALNNQAGKDPFLEMDAATLKTLPREVTIPIGKSADALLFFHFASTSGERKRGLYQTADLGDAFQWVKLIGEYEIQFQSGRKETVPLRAGLNIDNLYGFLRDDFKSPLVHSTPAIPVISLPGFTTGYIQAMEWRNPFPGEAIESITIKAIENQTGAFPVLVALNILMQG